MGRDSDSINTGASHSIVRLAHPAQPELPNPGGVVLKGTRYEPNSLV